MPPVQIKMKPMTSKNFPLVGNKVLAHYYPDSENLNTKIRRKPRNKTVIDAPKKNSANYPLVPEYDLHTKMRESIIAI